MTGLGDTNSQRKCSRPSEISESEKRVLKLKDVLLNTFINPFDQELDPEKLFNIASGCPTSEETASCLLGLGQRGTILYAEFNSRLEKDPACKEDFWAPLTQQVWKNFSTNNKKVKVKGSTGKTMEMKVQRDVLGFLVDEALKYPLSPVPLAIAHADGEKRKTDKSDLYKHAVNPSVSSSCSFQYGWKQNIHIGPYCTTPQFREESQHIRRSRDANSQWYSNALLHYICCVRNIS